jgi:hypothetical protein
MQLHYHHDIDHLSAEHTFRTSPLVMLMLPLILAGASGALVWAIAAGHLPLFIGFSVLFMAPFVPLVLWINFLPTLRSTNWVLKLADGQVYVMLRNYRNPHAPGDGPTVVSFSPGEIASVGREVLQLSSPAVNNGRRTYWNEYRLELRLRDAAPPAFVAALKAERDRKPPQEGMVRSKSYYASPVTLDDDGRTIRILWMGRFDWITPRLKRTLAVLERTFLRHEDSIINRRNTEAMSAAELDDLVLRLLESGQKIDAVKLLTRHRGMSTTQAVRFADDLLATPR